MSDWQQVTKYLDITRTTRDTTVNTKPYNVVKGHRIKKIPYTIVLTAYSEGISAAFLPAYIVWQYNVTLDRTYRLSNYTRFRTDPVSFGIINCHLCVRYRVGESVTRYRIAEYAPNSSPGGIPQLSGVPYYDGEVLPVNVVFEIWRRAFVPIPGQLTGLAVDLAIETDRYVNPSTPDELSSVIATVEKTSDIFTDMPEDIPTAYGENSAWITN